MPLGKQPQNYLDDIIIFLAGKYLSSWGDLKSKLEL